MAYWIGYQRNPSADIVTRQMNRLVKALKTNKGKHETRQPNPLRALHTQGPLSPRPRSLPLRPSVQYKKEIRKFSRINQLNKFS